ncbi:MAG: MAPEG family protein [Myxococcales bacterium]|nr:MAPEG family protein [Myxococcales bacterium]MBL0193064.1 MAPEG family protein [Myxococcales bacterium]
MSLAAHLAAYKGPVVVTAAYFGLWYTLLLGLQRSTKYKLLAEYAARGETFDRYFGQDARMLAADRAVANTQEQMVPFLLSMWLHAVFVSPTHATWLGLLYVVLRSLYPVLLGARLSKTQSKRVFLVTGPCYAIVFYLLGSAVYAVVAPR